MGFIIFLIIVVALVLFVWIILAILGLFFGGRDPYEEELKRMDYEDAMLERMEKRSGDTYVNVDARQIHLHNYK